MDNIPIFQFWLGERPDGIVRLENTIKSVYTSSKKYYYQRLTEADLPPELRDLIPSSRPENLTDVCRYWLIYQNGGVWFDSDMVSRREIPFHDILEINSEIAITGNVRQSAWCSTCIMAANPGCFLFKKLYDRAFYLLKNNGRNFPYDLIGPKLAFKIMRSHPKKWYCLPNHGIIHQSFHGAPPWARYRDIYSDTYQDMVYTQDWYYAHFCGGNVRYWIDNQHRDTVINRTILRAEEEF